MKWTEDKVQVLKEGIDNKMTHAEIANTLDTNENSVRLKAQKLKINSRYFERLKEVVDCLNCNESFESLISENRKFCCHSCSATYLNSKRPKKIYKIFECRNCKKQKPIPEYLKNKIFCSKKCHREEEYNSNISRWKSGELLGYTGKTKSLTNWLRKYLLEKYNNSCVKCGWNELHPVDNKPLVEINHIDGNAENNLEDNLEILCPNCHSMTYNFRARNKSSTRIRK